MDELLKNCNTELFKVGDKVRIRQDIKGLFVLRTTDIGRYSRIFPNKIQTGDSRYKITGGMVACAGKIAEVTEIIQGPPESLLLSTLYRLKINGSDSEWCWKHALLEKVEEDVETDGSKWELPFKVGTKVKITPNLKSGRHKDFDIKGKCYRDVGVIDMMELYKGKEATITSVNKIGSDVIGGGYAYLIEVDGEETGWNWDISMFDGFNAWRDKQEADAKRDSGGSTQFPLKVGDIVTIRRDIAEKRDKSGCIWSTVNGRKFKSPFITDRMCMFAGSAFEIETIAGCGLDTTYALDCGAGFCWSINCFEEFHDYKAYVEGKSGEKKTQPPKKQPPKKRGYDYYKGSQEIIDDVTGIEIDFFAYDYKGRKRMFPDIDGFITKIDVTIISGDETGLVYFVKDGKANRIAFDASVGTRFISYDDGTYTVEGKDNIKRWLSWSYDKDKAKNVNYAIQHMIDFLGGDK